MLSCLETRFLLEESNLLVYDQYYTDILKETLVSKDTCLFIRMEACEALCILSADNGNNGNSLFLQVVLNLEPDTFYVTQQSRMS